MLHLSVDEARRIAIAAQGLDRPRPPGRVDRRHARKVFDTVGLIQIDSVNVLARAQEMPLWARLGPHPRDVLPTMAAAGELIEYWGHEASLIRAVDEPWFRWRMDAARNGEATWQHVARMRRERPGFIDDVRDQIRERGPLTAADLRDGPGSTEPWWGWDDTKLALEALFWTGDVSAVRGKNFERRYDLRERMLPAEVLAIADPSRPDAHRELLRRAARSIGVGWLRDLADYYRLKLTDARPRVAELVDEGVLTPVRIGDWNETAYLAVGARAPRRVHAASLVSPFDPIVWERKRTERLFDFHYRIEIYTPAPKRRFGYYVLPFVYGDRPAARVDLKADRKTSTLLVPGAFLEPDEPAGEVADALASELRALAGWLGLDRITLGRRGNLAATLRSALPR